MNILIDIGHPAHVHYFKNFIKLMKMKGHNFLIIARDKEITHTLLNTYKIPFVSRGSGGKSLIKKILYIPIADRIIYKESKKFKPDLFLSFASTYAAHVSKIIGKPHIALDDTEHAKLELLMYPPFTDVILTPSCFSKDLGKKQLFFDSFTELLYLHPDHFSPNPIVLKLLDLEKDEDFAIVRFVSWDASHDIKEKGLSNYDKIKLVEQLANKMRVFVSSEGDMPKEISKYKFHLPYELLHDVLFFARLYVGEGGTTASEAALLGTPAVYINNLTMGYIDDEKRAGLLFQSTLNDEIDSIILNILDNYSKVYFKKVRDRFISNKIDPTAFLVRFIENYPKNMMIINKS